MNYSKISVILLLGLILSNGAVAQSDSGNTSVIQTEWEFEICQDTETNLQGEECEEPNVVSVKPFMLLIYALATFFIGGYIISYYRWYWKK